MEGAGTAEGGGMDAEEGTEPRERRSMTRRHESTETSKDHWIPSDLNFILGPFGGLAAAVETGTAEPTSAASVVRSL